MPSFCWSKHIVGNLFPGHKEGTALKSSLYPNKPYPTDVRASYSNGAHSHPNASTGLQKKGFPLVHFATKRKIFEYFSSNCF